MFTYDVMHWWFLFVQTATRVLVLRQKWHSLFLRRMRSPSKPMTQADEVSKKLTSAAIKYHAFTGFLNDFFGIL